MVQAGAGCVLYVNNVPSKGWLVWGNRTLALAASLERGDGLPLLLSGSTCVCSSHSCILGSGLQVSLSLKGSEIKRTISQKH